MVLGTVVTPATVVNADANDSAVTQAGGTADEKSDEVTNKINFVDENNASVAAASTVTGKVGAAIVVPESLSAKYKIYPGTTPVLEADGSTQTVKLATIANFGDVTVNYVDANGLQVGQTTVSGLKGSDVAVPEPGDNAKGYTLSNSKATVNIQAGKAYSVHVTKSISNTIIFETADKTQVGKDKTRTVTGTKVGDSVDVTSVLPAGYALADGVKVSLQADGNTQIVTVKKTSGDQTPFVGVVTVNPNANFVQLYTVTGAKGVRGLAGGSSWKTATKMVLDGVTYYQVSTYEWLKQSDVTVKDSDGNTVSGSDNTNTDNSGVQKADRSTVTTIDGNIIFLYTKDGELITTRGLGGNTSWRTDQMITVKGEKMYRVATNEWLKVSELK